MSRSWNNVVLVKFELKANDLPIGYDINFMTSDRLIDENLSCKEVIFLSERLSQNIDLILLDLKNLPLKGGSDCLVHCAYTNKTPIFGVGEKDDLKRFPRYAELVLSIHPTITEAIDHFKRHYIKF